MTPFQNWMTHFPLWHRWKPIGMWKGKKLYEADYVARAVHLPWKGRNFRDYAIPIRILAEYLHTLDREYDLKLLPNLGDTLTYESWLKGELRYTRHGEAFFEPTGDREPSLEEYYGFMLINMSVASYTSLTANSDSIDASELAPGDMLVAHDDLGRMGATYIVLRMLVNADGDKLYAVATGEYEACDFYIPLLTGDRIRPWVDVTRIKALSGSYPHWGFFRFRIQ